MQENTSPTLSADNCISLSKLNLDLRYSDNGEVDQCAIVDKNYLCGSLFVGDGFFRQSVLLRKISSDEKKCYAQYSGHRWFSNQLLVRGDDFNSKQGLEDLIDSEFHSNIEIQVVRAELPLIDEMVQLNESDLVSDMCSLLADVLTEFRLAPQEIQIGNFFIERRDQTDQLKMAPVTKQCDLYTDEDISVLLGNISFLLFQLITKNTSTLAKTQYFDLVDQAQSGNNEILKGKGFLSNHLLIDDSPEGLVDILLICLALGVPFQRESFFDGSCSIDRSIRNFAQSLFRLDLSTYLSKLSEQIINKELNDILADILQECPVEEHSDMETGVSNKAIQSDVQNPERNSVLDDTVVLSSIPPAKSQKDVEFGLDETLIISGK